MDLIAKVKRMIVRHGMVPRGSRVLAAVSGGADSMAMLEALLTLAHAMKYEVGVAHVDHGLRESSRRDLEFVKEHARRRGIAFHSARAGVKAAARRSGRGIEETARELRYRALQGIAKDGGYDRIATGHTASDQAETVLMRIISGSGLRGVAGILPVKDGLIVRPLLSSTRGEVMDLLKKRGIAHVADETNADETFTRNLIRRRLIPLMAGLNPGVVHALARLAENAREAQEFMDAAACRRAAKALLAADRNRAELDRAAFNRLPPVLKEIVLGIALKDFPKLRLDRDHVVAVETVAAGPRAFASLDLPAGLLARFSSDRIIFKRRRRRRRHISLLA